MNYNSFVSNILTLNNRYNFLTRQITDILLSKSFNKKLKKRAIQETLS